MNLSWFEIDSNCDGKVQAADSAQWKRTSTGRPENRTLRGSAGNVVARLLVILMGVLLAGCDGPVHSIRFRVTVEDDVGKALGSGVWEWRQWSGTLPVYDRGLNGDAFTFLLPDRRICFALPIGGKEGVPRSGDLSGRSGPSRTFERAGVIKSTKESENDPHWRIAALRNIRQRVELEYENYPFLVTYGDLRDRETVKPVLPTGAGSNLMSAPIRIFIQVSTDPVTYNADLERLLPGSVASGWC